MKTEMQRAVDAVLEAFDNAGKRGVVELEKVCRRCKASCALLVHDPEKPQDPARQVCGECAGKSNREQLDNLRPRKGDAPHETARKRSW